MREISTVGWFDEECDIYRVKLTVINEPDVGNVTKKGVIFSVTDEQLRYLAEAQEYPSMRPREFAVAENETIVIPEEPEEPAEPEVPKG